MARKKKDTEQRPELVNSEARLAAIRDGMKGRLALDAEIARLTELHIKPLKDQRRKDWKNLSADTGMHTKDLDIEYAQYKRLHEAQDFDEEIDRDRVVDAQNELREAMREVYADLGVGQTGDMFEAGAKAKQKRKGVFDGGDPAPAVPPTETTAETEQQDEPAEGETTEGETTEEPAAEGEKLEDEASTDDQDPRTSPMFIPHRGAGAAAFGQGKGEDACPYKAGSQAFVGWMCGYFRAEGAKAYRDGSPITACTYSTGSGAWKDWNYGWNDEARKDGADAGAVGRAAAEAVKGDKGKDEYPDIPAKLDRRRKPTTTQTGTA